MTRMGIASIILLCSVCCSCSSLTFHKEQKQIYELDNGTTVYQYSVSRHDGTAGIVLSNYNGTSIEQRPIILHITGSGCESNLKKKSVNSISGRSFGDFVKTAGDRYWVFTLEKRGVLPFDIPDPRKEFLACSREYHENDNIESRSRDNIEFLNWLAQQAFVVKNKLAIAGCSEGGYVAARIAKESNIPTHIGSFSGVGPSQMYDFLIFTRGLWKSPNEGQEKTEQRVAELMDQYRDIFKNPHSTDKGYLGFSYSKWIDSFRTSSLDDLLKTDQPVFMVNGSKDESSPIEIADFVEIEFIRHRKSNLTRKTYPGLDHAFRSCSPVTFKMTKNGPLAENNPKCNPNESNQFHLVIDDFLAWIETTP